MGSKEAVKAVSITKRKGRGYDPTHLTQNYLPPRLDKFYMILFNRRT